MHTHHNQQLRSITNMRCLALCGALLLAAEQEAPMGLEDLDG